MIDIAVQQGCHAKLTGSGGAVIGTYQAESDFPDIQKEYERHGFATIKVRVAGSPSFTSTG